MPKFLKDPVFAFVLTAIAISVILFHSSTAAIGSPKGNFNYGGATAFAAVNESLSTAIKKTHPQFNLSFDPQSIGTKLGIENLISGKLAFAHSNRTPSSVEIERAKQRGMQLEATPVALDAIAVFTNPANEVKSLTVTQLKNIYAGKITNWQQLGGINLPIIPVAIESSWLDLDKAFSNFAAVTLSKTYTEAIRKVGSLPGAVGYGSAAVVKGQKSIVSVAIATENTSIAIPSINADGSVNTEAIKQKVYPIVNKLYVITGDRNREAVATAYINLLFSESGREIIEQSGLVLLD